MKLFHFIIIISAPAFLNAQSDILDGYIKHGVENNLALKRANFDYEKSLYALKEARGMYYPNLGLNSRVSVADGGRTINFPIGDLMNPVYSTLNELTGSNQFPQVQNEQIDFLRPFEYDLRVSLIQPVFNPAIHYNSRINKELTETRLIDRDIYQRNLIAEIKTAYLNHLKASKAIELITDTRELVIENIRVNKSLFENDKVTVDYIYRSEAELSGLDQQMAEAEKSLSVSRKYFNFLLNKPLDSDIEIDTILGKQLPLLPGSGDFERLAEDRREIKLMDSYSKASDLNLKMNQYNYFPTLALAADYGFQGGESEINMQQDFIMLSVVLSWNLFNGFQRSAKVQQAKIDNMAILNKHEEVKNQLALQMNASYLDLIASLKAIEASAKQQESAEQAFYLINMKYKEGQANLLEYLDAQTTMTNARESYWLAAYDYYIKLADYEKEIEKPFN